MSRTMRFDAGIPPGRPVNVNNPLHKVTNQGAYGGNRASPNRDNPSTRATRSFKSSRRNAMKPMSLWRTLAAGAAEFKPHPR